VQAAAESPPRIAPPENHLVRDLEAWSNVEIVRVVKIQKAKIQQHHFRHRLHRPPRQTHKTGLASAKPIHQ
jgi:hypothetical protein